MKTPPQTKIATLRGFSLVELLAVMALVALLSGATAMMFSDGRAVGIKTSASQISSTLTMARDLAVTSNRRTRFIVLTEANSNPADLRLKSYGVLQYDTALAQYALASPLKHLPTGVYFDEDQENEAAGRGIFDSQDKFTIRGGEVEYAYVEFLPAGGTKATSGANIFSLVGGSAPGQPLPGGKDYARLGVAQHTGRVKVERK
jgi:prepilin-type N-terminal cleavage/methylation domain-containing protein